MRRQRKAVRIKEAEERRAARLQKRSAKAVADPQELEERAKRRAAVALDRLQAAEVAKRDAELAKAAERAARAALWEARRQLNLQKKMDRECARAEKEAHVKELVERLGGLGAKYALRSEAKMQRHTRIINRRERTPVEREALSKRRFENKQKTIQRRHARRLGLTLGQYQAYITERLTLQEALKRSKDGFFLAQ
jgi:hypothetical protein